MTLPGLRASSSLLLAAALLATACGSSHPAGTSSSSSSSTAAASSASSSGGDPCAAATTCDACAQLPACGFCWQTMTCAAGDASGPATGTCASWQPYDGIGVCFGPIQCDPLMPAAATACSSGEACYIVSSTEGTRCLPTGTTAGGASCDMFGTVDQCVPGYECDFMKGDSAGACHQICTLGDDGTCPAGLTCQRYLGVLHGPYGVCW